MNGGLKPWFTVNCYTFSNISLGKDGQACIEVQDSSDDLLNCGH